MENNLWSVCTETFITTKNHIDISKVDYLNISIKLHIHICTNTYKFIDIHGNFRYIYKYIYIHRYPGQVSSVVRCSSWPLEAFIPLQCSALWALGNHLIGWFHSINTHKCTYRIYIYTCILYRCAKDWTHIMHIHRYPGLLQGDPRDCVL